jgi:hypothetical protein
MAASFFAQAGRKDRPVPLVPDVAQALRKHVAAHKLTGVTLDHFTARGIGAYDNGARKRGPDLVLQHSDRSYFQPIRDQGNQGSGFQRREPGDRIYRKPKGSRREAG